LYNDFFGFKEKPFKLTPNPEYLFLSRSHEEAMAHLTYAVSDGEGFVEITGEVGTGKTTLCRAFLETLDEKKAQTAFIFNPKLDAIQLLKTINDEFSINSKGDTVKDLIDALNAFLMEKKREGKTAILLIDEAQNLSVNVLEQLRLLSNLETTRDKLLQIILVGQPELGDLLDSRELRQLAQRITISCHLKPFNQNETKAYILHRINIASKKPGVRFTRGAFRTIHQYSGGVPRLINIAADRALLTAFGLNRKKITSAIVRTAVKELSGRRDAGRLSFLAGKKGALAGTAGMMVLGIMFFLLSGGKDSGMQAVPDRQSETARASKAIPREISTPAAATIAPPSREIEPEQAESVPVKTAASLLGEYLQNVSREKSRLSALSAVLAMWGEKDLETSYFSPIMIDGDFFRLSAKRYGFSIYSAEMNFDLLKKLNLPAVLEVLPPGKNSPVFVALCGLNDQRATLKRYTEDPGISVEIRELSGLLGKTFFLPWKNFYNYQGIIPITPSKESVLSLKMHIRDLGFSDIDSSPDYDEKTRHAVIEIQKKYGLPEDGLVGPLTKIILYNENKKLNIPKIGG
jgi:general secretion pathway protein A